MSYDNNPVDTPTNYGFTEAVGVIELSEPLYSFDLLAVLRNDDGYFLGTDSGCSCPSPWENHRAEDFTGPLTAEQAAEEITSLSEAAYGGVYDMYERDALIARLV